MKLPPTARLRAHYTSCPTCRALPGTACTYDSGRSRGFGRPHADRQARAHGLARTPRSGQYARPAKPLEFSLTECKAFVSAGFELPGKPAPHVTVTSGMRGWFAVLVWWNDEDADLGGFWEPWQSGVGSSPDRAGAEEEARAWAEAEGLEFVP